MAGELRGSPGLSAETVGGRQSGRNGTGADTGESKDLVWEKDGKG